MKLRSVAFAALVAAFLRPPNVTVPPVGSVAALVGLGHHAEFNGREVEVLGRTSEGLAIVRFLSGGDPWQVAATHLLPGNATAGAPRSANATRVNASSSSAPASAASSASSALLQSRQPEEQPDAQMAVLVGMKADKSLNGQRVQVLGFDKPSGRYVVKLADGSERKVKEEHLAQPDSSEAPQKEEATLTGMAHDTSLNGQRVEVLGFDKASGRYVVQLADGSKRKVQEEHLQPLEEPGGSEQARIVGMTKDLTLNGKLVQVLDFDKESSRYIVQLPDGSKRKIKEEHLEQVQEGLRDGSSAVLVHMKKDPALNGQRVKVASFDGKSGRYVVKLKDGTMRKVLEEHLKEAPDEERHLAQIVGMTKAPNLNGQTVTVVGVDQKTGRFVVKLEGGQMFKVTPEHLADTSATTPAPVDAVPALLDASRTAVEVIGFDQASGEYVVVANASRNGSYEELVDLSRLGGLTNASALRIAALTAAGKRAPVLPQLTVCNAYQSRKGVTVVARHSENRSDDLLVAANMPYASCVDLEYPTDRGELAFLQENLQVGSYPFLVSGTETREVLLLRRLNVNSLEAAVMRAEVKARPERGQVVVFNAATGMNFVALSTQYGGSKHNLAFNQLYDLAPGRYAMDMTAEGIGLSSELDVKIGHTYVAVATGIAEGLKGEPTPPGFLLHGVDSFDVREQAPAQPRAPAPAKPRKHPAFLQRSEPPPRGGLVSFMRAFLR
jgi:hypothetical protein